MTVHTDLAGDRACLVRGPVDALGDGCGMPQLIVFVVIALFVVLGLLGTALTVITVAFQNVSTFVMNLDWGWLIAFGVAVIVIAGIVAVKSGSIGAFVGTAVVLCVVALAAILVLPRA